MDYLIVCIGNREGGDDAVGPFIADQLINKNIEVIDCGTVPENYTSVIKQKNPKHLIIIDAFDMGLSAGELRIVPKQKIGIMHISTHGIPIPLLVDYLSQTIQNIILVGIQPKTMKGAMSAEVQKSAMQLMTYIQNKKINDIPLLG